jgi:hypothetical protein
MRILSVGKTIVPALFLSVSAALGSGLANSSLFNFQASGPAALVAGQTASFCATNLDTSTVFVLIAVLQADTGGLSAVQQQVPQGGAGTCLNYPASPNLPAGSNISGLGATKASLTELGGIVQSHSPGGGGCIAASIQIQTLSPNIGAQTFLYVRMKDFQEDQSGQLRRPI